MELGTVRQIDINEEMQQAYLSYAMSVIVSRALPDVRDGLKPVQRRILYAMHDMGLAPNSPYRKSARIVGEVLGKYHPHGDAAVYEAMARMAQDFSLRYPLVDGQGNFGSVDGDPPAAMRYTEARLSSIAVEMMTDIDKDTVDWVDNFDGTLQEPAVLPATLPNLLVNGSSGIAVGMATNIPPHNLSEVCNALVYMIDHYRKLDDVTVDDLMQFIQGPDFPTGGVVYRFQQGRDGEVDALKSAYAVGRGRVTVQARAHIEEMTRGRHRIVVTELPYQVNKTSLIERIASLVRSGRIEGISDLRDESDRQGMRLVIELSRTAEPRQVLEQLFKHTPLQSTFSIILLALVDGEPRLLSLKKILQHYLEHRQEIVVRRSRYELEKAKHRAHILEGLLTALDHLDEVISIIRRSRTADTARTNLRRRFKLTEVQAQAILDMPLRRLAALERRKLQDEYKELKKRIRYLEKLLRSPKRIREVVKEELLELKARYGDPRRTQIVAGAEVELTAHDLVPEEEALLVLTRGGLIRRAAPDQVSQALKGTRGKQALLSLWRLNTRDILYFFTADGQAVQLPVYRVPDLTLRKDGSRLSDLCSLRGEVVAVLPLPHADEPVAGYLVLGTRGGRVKRVALTDFLSAVGKGETVVMKVDADDALVGVQVTEGKQEVLLVTRQGRAIRFSEEEVRPMGLSAGGVMGIKLADDDVVVAVEVVRPRSSLLVVSERGYAKWTALSEYPAQKRYGSGVVGAKVSQRTGPLVGGCVVKGDDVVYLVPALAAAKKLRVRQAPRMGRATQGKRVVDLKDKDRLLAVVPVGMSPSLTKT